MESTVAKDRATVSVVKSRAELGRAHQELLQLMKLGSDRSDWQTDRYHLLMLVVEDYHYQVTPGLGNSSVKLNIFD